MGDEGITFLQYLISHHREPDSAVNLINHNGETPLHIATRLSKTSYILIADILITLLRQREVFSFTYRWRGCKCNR